MNYATIKNCDIANGPGVRVSIFVSGCTRHCKDCFNREVWDFQYGAPFTQETIDQILSYLAPDHIRGINLVSWSSCARSGPGTRTNPSGSSPDTPWTATFFPKSWDPGR